MGAIMIRMSVVWSHLSRNAGALNLTVTKPGLAPKLLWKIGLSLALSLKFLCSRATNT
jgi:hypothetical protein